MRFSNKIMKRQPYFSMNEASFLIKEAKLCLILGNRQHNQNEVIKVKFIDSLT